MLWLLINADSYHLHTWWMFQSGTGKLCSSLKQRKVFVFKTNLKLCCLTCSRSLVLSGFAWKWLVILIGWWSCALASSLSSLHWRTSSCWSDEEVYFFKKALHWGVEDSRNDALDCLLGFWAALTASVPVDLEVCLTQSLICFDSHVLGRTC